MLMECFKILSNEDIWHFEDVATVHLLLRDLLKN